MKIKRIIAIFSIAMVFCGSCTVNCFAYPFDDYIISYDNDILPSAEAAKYINCIRGDDIGVGDFNDISCIRASADGSIAIADSGNNRVVVTDSGFNLRYIISEFDNADKKDMLSGPKGVFISEKGILFIADTSNSRILSFKLADGSFVKEFSAPVSPLLEDDFVYLPTSLAVDSNGRMYVVAQNVNQGLMTFDSNGEFVGYIGANKVSVNPLQQILKRFSTDEQIERMNQSTPTEYNSMTIDSDGFIYTTTSAISASDVESAIRSKSKDDRYAPIKKLNASGVDVLLREGAYMPMGDTAFISSDEDVYHVKGQSLLCDIVLGEAGSYAVLDNKRGRIFKYDERGNLLYEFGGLSKTESGFVNPISLTWYDGIYMVADISRQCIVQYMETEYGECIEQALLAYSDGDYELAEEKWSSILNTNANCEIAYNGLGLIAYHNKDYSAAKQYFLLAQNKTNYSKASKKLRTEKFTENFTAIAVAIISVVVISVVIYVICTIKKRLRHIVNDYSSRVSK